MRVRLAFRGMCILALLAITGGHALVAQSQDPKAHVSEATAFFRELAQQTGNPLIAGMARENLAKLQQNPYSTQEVIIPLLEQPDSSLVVPGMIGGKVMGTFLVDTGSSYTVITPAMARKLGVVITPQTPRASLITANGIIKAPLVTLKNVSIGQVRVPEVTAVVQELGNGEDLLLSGLLGMNYFQGMDITVKQHSLVLGIRR